LDARLGGRHPAPARLAFKLEGKTIFDVNLKFNTGSGKGPELVFSFQFSVFSFQQQMLTLGGVLRAVGMVPLRKRGATWAIINPLGDGQDP
jgi:hypothetical protein